MAMIMGKYKAAYAPDHPKRLQNNCVYEHILVAEEKLGRRLNDGEVIHHRDQDKNNNNPDNIIIFCSKSEHTRFHKYNCDESILIELNNGTYACDASRTKEQYVCPVCGKFKDRKADTCRECYDLYRNKKVTNRPSREELKNMIRTCAFTSIGKQYGVTDNAIRKWCKNYNLPYRTSDIKLISDENWELI